jgi:hypothetical protein
MLAGLADMGICRRLQATAKHEVSDVYSKLFRIYAW